jgi:hypothetical protein
LDGRASWVALRVDAIAQIVRHKRRCPHSRGSDFGIPDKADQAPDVRDLVELSVQKIRFESPENWRS